MQPLIQVHRWFEDLLGLVFVAYLVIRRRQGLAPSGRGGPRRSNLVLRSGHRASKSTGSRRGLRVLGRVGVGRSSQVIAVQFAETVFLLAASESSTPSVLAELDLATWTAATEVVEDVPGGLSPTSARPTRPGARPVGLVEALRDATLRRG